MHEHEAMATTSNGKIYQPTKSNLVGWVHETDDHLYEQKNAIVKVYI